MDDVKIFLKRIYYTSLIIFILGIVLLVGLKMKDISLESFYKTWHQYMFKDTLINFAIYIVLLSPMVFYLLKFVLTELFPIDVGIRARVKKTEKVLAIVIGGILGTLLCALILFIAGDLIAKVLLVLTAFLCVVGVCITMFLFKYKSR